MNKKVLKVVFVATIGLVSGINVYNFHKSEIKLSDIAMANVEALAVGEYDYENGSARKENATIMEGPYYFTNPSGGYYEVYYIFDEVKCYDKGILKCQETITYVDTYIKEDN